LRNVYNFEISLLNMKDLYLDNAATTPVRKEVVEEMKKYLSK
jgi:selenocysteine lyase/cysteine desulfurase